jgi:hypothetical protein
MQPETIIKISIALLSEAEQSYRWKANECLVKSMSLNPDINSRESSRQHDLNIQKATFVKECIEKLNNIGG